MDIDKEVIERIIQCLIDENESLREDMNSLKESIGILIENVEDLNEFIADLEEFSDKDDEGKTADLIRLRKIIKMMEKSLFGVNKDED